MSELNKFIGALGLNRRLCTQFLTGTKPRREEILKDFPLTPEQKALILSINAVTLQDFSEQLLQKSQE